MSIEDIFPEDDYSWIKGEGNLARQAKCRDKKMLARQIFNAFMLEVIWECIEGNEVITPVKELMTFFVQSKKQSILDAKKKRGYYRIYDFDKTFGKAFELVVTFKRKGRTRYYPTRLAKKHYAAIAGRANEGQVYLYKKYG